MTNHKFVGRTDRWCEFKDENGEVCDKPDRNDIHRVEGEPSWFAPEPWKNEFGEHIDLGGEG